MANLVHRLVENKSSLRLIRVLNTPLLSKLTPSLIPHQTTPIATTEPEPKNNPLPLLNPTITKNVGSDHHLRFYPSFPFGYCLNAASSTGFVPLDIVESEEVESSDAGTVYADSVKKKRKKKMNKHKYKKLRKRLRRKT